MTVHPFRANLQRRIGVASLCVLLVSSATARSANAAGPSAAQGRKHLTRASQLSAKGRCKPALPEFTKAYEILKDPAILFNRAECFRKLGNAESAIEDYRRFLEGMPKAPNRGAVEARIAELGGTPASGGPVGAGAPPVATPAPAVPAKLGEGAAPPPPPSAGPHPRPAVAGAAGVAGEGPASPPAAPGAPAEPTLPAAASEPAQGPGPQGPPPGLVPPPSAAKEYIIDLSEKSSAAEPKRSISPWVWFGVGVVAIAGGAFAGWYFLGRAKTDVPDSALGNFKF